MSVVPSHPRLIARAEGAPWVSCGALDELASSAECERGLVLSLAHPQARRLAASESGEDAGCEEEARLEVEVLQLRREVAETKVRLAELTEQSFADKRELAALRAASKKGSGARFW